METFLYSHASPLKLILAKFLIEFLCQNLKVNLILICVIQYKSLISYVNLLCIAVVHTTV
jgi:hypothetical protein